MPTVKIDINSGIESYPTDGIDSSVKLHNFTVGSDGSLYKLPVLKNLKTVEYQNVGTVGPNTKIVPYRIQDLRKFQTTKMLSVKSLPKSLVITKSSFTLPNPLPVIH